MCRAAKVPVDLCITKILKTTGQDEKIFWVGMQELWDNYQFPVFLRQEIFKVFWLKIRVALGVDKGGQGRVKSGEMTMKEAAEVAVRDSADGGQDEMRCLFSHFGLDWSGQPPGAGCHDCWGFGRYAGQILGQLPVGDQRCLPGWPRNWPRPDHC